MAHSELLTLQRLELPLDPPLVNARGEWRQRSTLIARLHDAHGRHGHGEAAPLPHFSRDSLEDCERALEAIPPPRLAALDGVTSPRVLLDAAADLLPERVPAARFALETALLDRLGRRSGQPLWRLLVELLPGVLAGLRRPVELCALLPSHDPEAAISKARCCERAGVRAFKLKIGPDRLGATQLATLAALRSVLDPGIELRLDANGSLTPGELHPTLRQLATFRPGLVEEPLAELDLAAYAASPVPLALDESLQTLDARSVNAFLGLSTGHALVLKPTALGGFARCLDFATRSALFGRRVIVSHTLEGPIGWGACAHLAIALRQSGAAGLWPLRHQRGGSPSVVGGLLMPGDAAGLGPTS